MIILGLFDAVVGAFRKGDAGKYKAILSWVEEQGGIQVLLEKLQSGGLGASLSTWLSNQQSNQPVSGEQLESALGTNAVSDLGQKLGVDTSTASSLLGAISRLAASNWNQRSAQTRCPISGKNLAWIPVQLPAYWQSNCRRLLMHSHRKVKGHHKLITICFPQAWNC